MSQQLVTEEFLDTYEGDIMFLSQDLEELEQKFLNCEFTLEDIELLTQNMLDVHDVFLSSSYTQHIAPMFKEFSEFLASKTLQEYLENQEALSYLCAIIVDINTYINQYFVDRIFKDVYLFQDSLKNSIEFFIASFESQSTQNEDDGSEVLFF